MVSYNAILLAAAASAAVAAPAPATNYPSSPRFSTQSNNAWVEGAQESMINHQQVVDTLNRQVASQNGHNNADRIIAAITGADSQIDNAIATVAHAMGPFTGGLSLAVGNFLLGPFVQSVTNGAEVFLGNMIGGAEDRVQNAAASYTSNLSNLRAHAVQYNVNTNRLDRAISRFQALSH